MNILSWILDEHKSTLGEPLLIGDYRASKILPDLENSS